MPKSQSLQRILAQAKKKEKRYDWLGAVEFHKKALDQVLKQKEFLKAGGVQERIGYCFHRGAMQAKSRQEFRARCAEAIENYEKSKGFYGKLRDPVETPRVLRCDAMIAYVNYWLTVEVPEKKRLIDACWRLAKEALRAFEEASDAWEYGKTYNQLSMSIAIAFSLEWDPQVRENTIREAVKYGDRAIKFLSTCEDFNELARAYVKTATSLQVLAYNFVEPDEQKTYFQKASDYWLKANEASEEIAVLELLSVACMTEEDARRSERKE